ncbi:acyltransferase family protein [Weissella diestrammenae]|uniref:Acyltransferase family protein n=1 Tax=Weissella diestrammenae TaxID=1162633 RepID=A0A7G9T5B5_9LACO|nr:acyltransferase family protein [Weissella diestrammenae]MCM0583148.1 acyltransferase family protein [Weissella diestrammenae]QNN75290.1 acyltransferase family protein [Weissella diestrammenae]
MRREAQIDLIKAVAVFFVVNVHFLLNSGFYDVPLNSGIQYFWLFMRLFLITAVPLFIMVTGYLSHTKQLTAQQLKKIYPVIITYIIISLLDYGAQILILGHTTPLNDAIRGIFDFSTDSYAWYVEMYIPLFFMMPLFNIVWHRHENDVWFHRYIVILSVMIFFVPSLLNQAGKIVPDFFQAAYPVGYYFIGAYIHTYREKIRHIRWRIILPIFVMTSVLLGTINFFINDHHIFKWADYNDYFGYQVLVMSVLLMIMMLRIPDQWLRIPGLKLISNATLSIYLASDITDQILYPMLKHYLPAINDRLTYGSVTYIISFIFASLIGISVTLVVNAAFKRKR